MASVPSLEARNLLRMGQLEFLHEFREGHFVATVVDHRRGRYTSSSA